VTYPSRVPLLVLVGCLEWCHSYLEACHFQSALFLTGSRLFSNRGLSRKFVTYPTPSSRVALGSRWTPSGEQLAERNQSRSNALTFACSGFASAAFSCPHCLQDEVLLAAPADDLCKECRIKLAFSWIVGASPALLRFLTSGPDLGGVARLLIGSPWSSFTPQSLGKGQGSSTIMC